MKPKNPTGAGVGNRRGYTGVNSLSGFSVFAPAKLNLFLAITGRRSDGFHDLVSLVTPVDYGDTLHVEPAGHLSLTCDDPVLACDESNLVLKAARAYRETTGWTGGANFFLEKRVPTGAGLGGGSSDAVAALRALDRLAGHRLEAGAMEQVAARIGSDCALFLKGGPVVMRGRGERVTALAEPDAARLRGQRVLIFKPAFGIPTAWAYSRMAAKAGSYLPAEAAEKRLADWQTGTGRPDVLLFNNMENEAFAKFVALPALLSALRRDFALQPRMSGSGSACFAFLAENSPVGAITVAIREAWGASAWVQETRLT
jgi:4-diphosphocytidyl-2-C-methyl-D-erythritol kinase